MPGRRGDRDAIRIVNAKLSASGFHSPECNACQFPSHLMTSLRCLLALLFFTETVRRIFVTKSVQRDFQNYLRCESQTVW